MDLADTQICLDIIERLVSNNPNMAIFMSPAVDTLANPVEKKRYLETIRNPIDFTIIKNKISKGEYRSLQDFVNDAKLCFQNSIEYCTKKKIEYFLPVPVALMGDLEQVVSELIGSSVVVNKKAPASAPKGGKARSSTGSGKVQNQNEAVDIPRDCEDIMLRVSSALPEIYKVFSDASIVNTAEYKKYVPRPIVLRDRIQIYVNSLGLHPNQIDIPINAFVEEVRVLCSNVLRYGGGVGQVQQFQSEFERLLELYLHSLDAATRSRIKTAPLAFEMTNALMKIYEDTQLGDDCRALIIPLRSFLTTKLIKDYRANDICLGDVIEKAYIGTYKNFEDVKSDCDKIEFNIRAINAKQPALVAQLVSQFHKMVDIFKAAMTNKKAVAARQSIGDSGKQKQSSSAKSSESAKASSISTPIATTSTSTTTSTTSSKTATTNESASSLQGRKSQFLKSFRDDLIRALQLHYYAHQEFIYRTDLIFYPSVDPILFPTYAQVIERPMSLKVMLKRPYQDLDSIFEDLALIRENCHKFNIDDEFMRIAADSMYDYAKFILKIVMKDLEFTQDTALVDALTTPLVREICAESPSEHVVTFENSYLKTNKYLPYIKVEFPPPPRGFRRLPELSRPPPHLQAPQAPQPKKEKAKPIMELPPSAAIAAAPPPLKMSLSNVNMAPMAVYDDFGLYDEELMQLDHVESMGFDFIEPIMESRHLAPWAQKCYSLLQNDILKHVYLKDTNGIFALCFDKLTTNSYLDTIDFYEELLQISEIKLQEASAVDPDLMLPEKWTHIIQFIKWTALEKLELVDDRNRSAEDAERLGPLRVSLRDKGRVDREVLIKDIVIDRTSRGNKRSPAFTQAKKLWETITKKTLKSAEHKNVFHLLMQPTNINEVEDYHVYVDDPMDFGTIWYRLTGECIYNNETVADRIKQHDMYVKYSSFISDLRLVLANATVYNENHANDNLSKLILEVVGLLQPVLEQLIIELVLTICDRAKVCEIDLKSALAKEEKRRLAEEAVANNVIEFRRQATEDLKTIDPIYAKDIDPDLKKSESQRQRLQNAFLNTGVDDLQLMEAFKATDEEEVDQSFVAYNPNENSEDVSRKRANALKYMVPMGLANLEAKKRKFRNSLWDVFAKKMRLSEVNNNSSSSNNSNNHSNHSNISISRDSNDHIMLPSSEVTSSSSLPSSSSSSSLSIPLSSSISSSSTAKVDSMKSQEEDENRVPIAPFRSISLNLPSNKVSNAPAMVSSIFMDE